MVILVLFYNEETEAEKLSYLVKVTTQLISDDLILEPRKSDCRDHALSSNTTKMLNLFIERIKITSELYF